MKYNEEEVGKKIRSERKKLHLTQSMLGEKLGYKSGKQISIYETGELIPPIDVLFDLCNIFDCELGYLLGEPEYSNGTKVDTAITERAGLTKEAIDNLQNIIGKGSKCLDFGYSSEEYKNILNRMLSSESLVSLMKSLHELDKYYSIVHGSGWEQAVEKYGEDRMNKAYDIYSGDTNFRDLTKEEVEDYKIMGKIIDGQYDADFYIKMCRYDVWENFEDLLKEIFPTGNKMTE